MNTFLNYMIEASIAFVLFYGVYHFLLRNETNFHFVRFYLLFALLASVCIPLLDFTTNNNVIPTVSEAIPTYWLPEIVVGGALVKNELSFTVWQVLSTAYFIGLGFLLFKLLLQVKNLLNYFKNEDLHIHNNVIELNSTTPTFSFFNFIVIGQAHLLSPEEKQAIVMHEQVHATRYHSLDILFVNVLTILFWFHPIIYLYKKALVQVHEFEADSRAVTNHNLDQYCGLLAKVALYSAEFPIANHFNNSLTLKRITMLRSVKHTLAHWKKALVLIFFGGIFILIACEEQVISDIQTVAKQSSVVTTYPTHVLDDDGDLSTPIIDGRECAYAIYDKNKVLKCGIEEAYNDGKISYKKPISCHLYPIRISKKKNFEAVNYHKWNICSDACTLGKELQVPLYKFLKDPLIRKYGKEWYDELVVVIEKP